MLLNKIMYIVFILLNLYLLSFLVNKTELFKLQKPVGLK